MPHHVNRSRVYAEAAHYRGTSHGHEVGRLGHRQASMLDIMMGAARWYHTRAVEQSSKITSALAGDDASKRDLLATVKKLLALAVHPNTPVNEAAAANSKAEALLLEYAEATASGSNPVALAAVNSNWDKAAEHAARAAPYIHPKPAPQTPGARSLSELTTAELEAAAADARAELAAWRAAQTREDPEGPPNGQLH